MNPVMVCRFRRRFIDSRDEESTPPSIYRFAKR